jgi:hypothetical protein
MAPPAPPCDPPGEEPDPDPEEDDVPDVVLSPDDPLPVEPDPVEADETGLMMLNSAPPVSVASTVCGADIVWGRMTVPLVKTLGLVSSAISVLAVELSDGALVVCGTGAAVTTGAEVAAGGGAAVGAMV